jgi:hypothetical protein
MIGPRELLTQTMCSRLPVKPSDPKFRTQTHCAAHVHLTLISMANKAHFCWVVSTWLSRNLVMPG